jgi:hypothetical protein
MENSPNKRILALPNSNKRQAWESVVESASKSVDSNEELKSSLQRIGQAEKIPMKWNRLQKSQFMVCKSFNENILCCKQITQMIGLNL